ncbi:MAG: hypothetical protein K9L25_09995 [Methylovulum sp.]|jgi:hypothetical protein|nr:hypothetical protein [Methylovulum sp.]
MKQQARCYFVQFQKVKPLFKTHPFNPRLCIVHERVFYCLKFTQGAYEHPQFRRINSKFYAHSQAKAWECYQLKTGQFRELLNGNGVGA